MSACLLSRHNRRQASQKTRVVYVSLILANADRIPAFPVRVSRHDVIAFDEVKSVLRVQLATMGAELGYNDEVCVYDPYRGTQHMFRVTPVSRPHRIG